MGNLSINVIVEVGIKTDLFFSLRLSIICHHGHCQLSVTMDTVYYLSTWTLSIVCNHGYCLLSVNKEMVNCL